MCNFDRHLHNTFIMLYAVVGKHLVKLH